MRRLIFNKKTAAWTAVCFNTNTDLFCSFRQSTDALGAQCLFHRDTGFNDGDTLKVRAEGPVRRALGKALGVSESCRFTACFTFCHFVQFLSYLWSALFQLHILLYCIRLVTQQKSILPHFLSLVKKRWFFMKYCEYEHFFSQKRLHRYLLAGHGDKRKTMTLYRYNLHLA